MKLFSTYAIFLALFLSHVSAASKLGSQGRNLEESEDHKKKQIVGFWHIGPNFQPRSDGKTFEEFVMMQADEILRSYLFGEGLSEEKYDLKLNYVTTLDLSDETKSYLKSSGLIHELPPTALKMEDGKQYFEFPTLMELHTFCLAPENLDTIVFYIRSKTNDDLRIRFTNYVLGESCLRCLKEEGKKACGVTFKGLFGILRWSKFSGNFWMTNCNHISKLNPPWYPEILEEAKMPDIEGPMMAVPPYGRYFAEYWMLNDALGPRQPHAKKGKATPLLEQEDVCADMDVLPILY